MLFLRRERTEDRGVGGLVEGPDLREVEAFAVDAFERVTEDEDAVKAMELEEGDLFGRRGGAVVRVVEEETEAKLVSKF